MLKIIYFGAGSISKPCHFAEFNPLKDFVQGDFWENVNNKCDTQLSKKHFIFGKDELPSNLEFV